MRGGNVCRFKGLGQAQTLSSEENAFLLENYEHIVFLWVFWEVILHKMRFGQAASFVLALNKHSGPTSEPAAKGAVTVQVQPQKQQTWFRETVLAPSDTILNRRRVPERTDWNRLQNL